MTIRAYQSLFFVPRPSAQDIPWRNLGGPVQQQLLPQPPVRPIKRAAVMAATGVFLVLVPPSQLIQFRNSGGQVQQPQPPQPKWKRTAAIMRGDDGTQAVYVYNPVIKTWGWEPNAYAPANPLFNRKLAGAIRQRVSAAIPKNFVPWGETSTPITYKVVRRSGAIAVDDDGTQAPYIVVAPPAAVFVDSSLAQQPGRKPKQGGSAIRQRLQFGVYTPFVNWGWGVQEVQPPTPSLRRDNIAGIARGDDGIEAKFIFTAAAPNFWGWEPNAYAPANPLFNRKLVGAIRQRVSAAIPKDFVPWGETPASIAYKVVRNAGAISRQDDGTYNVFSGTPVLLTASFPWHEEPWVNYRRKVERAAAIATKDDGTQAVYIFTATTVKFGWEFQQSPVVRPTRNRSTAIDGRSDFAPFDAAEWGWESSWQPLHRRLEKSGAIARTNDEPLAAYVFTAAANPTLWATPEFQPRVRTSLRYGALRSRSTFSYFSPFVAWGWDVQSVQPPHPKRERWTATIRGDDGNQALFVGTAVLLTASFPWHEEPWVYPRRKVERAAAIATKDDGTQFSYIRWFNAGWELQSVQPPAPLLRRDNLAAIMRGDDGNYNLFSGTPVLLTGSFPWYESPWVYPRKKIELAGALATKDDGNEYLRLNWFNAGWEIQSVQPPRPFNKRGDGYLPKGDDGNYGIFVPPGVLSVNANPWYEVSIVYPRKNFARSAAILRGDDGTQGRFARWFNAGWEVQPYQPQHVWRERRGAYLRGHDGNDNVFDLGRTLAGSNIRIVYVLESDIETRFVVASINSKIVSVDSNNRIVTADTEPRGV